MFSIIIQSCLIQNIEKRNARISSKIYSVANELLKVTNKLIPPQRVSIRKKSNFVFMTLILWPHEMKGHRVQNFVVVVVVVFSINFCGVLVFYFDLLLFSLCLTPLFWCQRFHSSY